QIMSDAHKGKTLSDKTKQKISDAAKKSENSGWFKTGHSHSDESKQIMSDAKKGKPSGSCKPSQQIEVTDIKNNITIYYDSISEAARALNILQASISMYLKNNQ